MLKKKKTQNIDSNPMIWKSGAGGSQIESQTAWKTE